MIDWRIKEEYYVHKTMHKYADLDPFIWILFGLGNKCLPQRFLEASLSIIHN